MRVAACLVSQMHVCMSTNTSNIRSLDLTLSQRFGCGLTFGCGIDTIFRCMHVFLPTCAFVHVGVAYRVLIS